MKNRILILTAMQTFLFTAFADSQTATQKCIDYVTKQEFRDDVCSDFPEKIGNTIKTAIVEFACEGPGGQVGCIYTGVGVEQSLSRMNCKYVGMTI